MIELGVDVPKEQWTNKENPFVDDYEYEIS